MMRTLALVVCATAILATTTHASPLVQKTRPPESAADEALRKGLEAEGAKRDAEAERKAEAKKKRQAARKEAERKQGQQGDVPAQPGREAKPDAVRGKSDEREKDAVRPSDAGASASPKAGEIRRLSREVFALERKHRERIARIDRLKVVFREKGEIEKVQELEQMAERQERRHARGLEAYRREMGPEAFAAIETALEVGRERELALPGADARVRRDAKAGRDGDRPARQNADQPSDRRPDRAGSKTDRVPENQRRTDQPRRAKPKSDKPNSDRPRGGDKRKSDPSGGSDKPGGDRSRGDQAPGKKNSGNGRG